MFIKHNPAVMAAPAGLYTHGMEAPANMRWLYISGQVGVRPDYLLWDQQDVDGGLRLDVVERQAQVVFVGDLRRNLFVDDLLKDVVGEHRLPQKESHG